MPSLSIPPPDLAGHAADTTGIHGITDTATLLVTPIAGALDHNGATVGFYGVAPVARAAAIASPTSDALGTKAAVDAIRAALTAIGITL